MPGYRYKNPPAYPRRARMLRKQAPLPERLLWNALCALKVESGLKFRRQHPLYPYIVDFACISHRLIVELDGPSHDGRQDYDARRDFILKKKDWTILRFNNDDVLTDLEGVLRTILSKAEQALP